MMSPILPQEELPEPERYELVEEPRYEFELSRRAFVQIVGAGILITTRGRVAFAQRGRGQPATVAARLHVGEDGVVTVLTSKVEVGQGSRTQLTQAAAEELRLPLDRIRMLMADTDVVPDDGGTYGSLTTPRTVPAVRQAAATARELLLEAAGRLWSRDPSSLSVEDGKITDGGSERSVSYGALARLPEFINSAKASVSGNIEVTQVKDWSVLGKSALKTAAEDVVTGRLRYTSDIVREGMLYGKVLRPPSHGATLESVDLTPAQAMEGVVAVRDGDFAGCAATTTFDAEKALKALATTVRWREQESHTSSSKLFDYLKTSLRDAARGRRPRVQENGDTGAALAKAEATLEAEYHISYIQHAPMEPRASVAEWVDGKLTAWTGTQRPNGVRQELERAFSLSAGKVRVIVPDTGGGFGGKHTGDAAVEAARLAKAAGRPVRVQWTRQEEFTWAYFRPAGVINVAAGVSGDALTAWEHTNINSGASAIETPYRVPNARTEFIACDSPLREGSYRALAGAANVFAREAFMDEAAALAKTDPLEFRLEHIDNPRLFNVLVAAAMKGGWNDWKSYAQEARGIGLACATLKGSYTATCAQVTADRKRGTLNVESLCQAFECGAIQNPKNLRSQIEGCVIMGLGGALTEEILFENGRIINANFKQYRVPTAKDLPELNIVLLDRADLPSAGAGETPLITVAPAIANAVARATGVRLRSLPLRADLLKEA